MGNDSPVSHIGLSEDPPLGPLGIGSTGLRTHSRRTIRRLRAAIALVNNLRRVT